MQPDLFVVGVLGRALNLNLSVLHFFLLHGNKYLIPSAMQERLLDGKWEFIGAEIYIHSTKEWVNSDDYVKGMEWNFRTGFAFSNQEHGTIVESAPAEEQVEMEYLYSHTKQKLIVDIEVQDVYEVIVSPLGTAENPVIRLNILSTQYPLPYMRYILRRVG